MTTDSTSPPPPVESPGAPSKVKRHPIRGGIWGLIAGLGVAIALIGQAIIAAGTLTPWIITAAGLVVGVLWGMFGPAKKPKQPNTEATPPPPHAV